VQSFVPAPLPPDLTAPPPRAAPGDVGARVFGVFFILVGLSGLALSAFAALPGGRFRHTGITMAQSGLLFVAALALFFVVRGVVAFRAAARRVALQRNGRVAVGRVVGGGTHARGRRGSTGFVTYEVSVPAAGVVTRTSPFTAAQRAKLGRAPEAGDTAFVLYDPHDPRELLLWSVAGASAER
jgi:hypothetical protein